MQVLICFLVVFCLYFLPAIAAHSRHHKNRDAIFMLNLFLGWTFIGWVVSMVWAFTSHVEDETEIEAKKKGFFEVNKKDLMNLTVITGVGVGFLALYALL
jgi:TM2 domain-containing membrane protein YozV